MKSGNVRVFGRTRRVREAWLDVTDAVWSFNYYFSQAYMEVKQKYKRSVLGPLWNVFSALAFIIGFIVLGGLIFKQNRAEYVAYLAAGIIFWQFLVSYLVDVSNAFVQNHVYILSHDHSLSGYVLQTLLRNLIMLSHNLPLMFIASLYQGVLNWNTLLLVPGFILLFFLLFFLGLFLAFMTARFRDLSPAVVMLTQFMFYFTPIFWSADAIPPGPSQLIYLLNPFHHIMEIIRAPMLGDMPSLLSYGIVLGGLLLSGLLSFLIMVKFKARLAYWL